MKLSLSASCVSIFDLYSFQNTDLLNPLFSYFVNCRFSLVDKVTTETYNLVLFIWNVVAIATLLNTLFLVQLNSRWNLVLINGISNNLKGWINILMEQQFVH